MSPTGYVLLEENLTRQQQMDVNALLDKEEGLTEWEMEFVENIYNGWWDRPLTEKQEDTLRRIVDKRL